MGVLTSWDSRDNGIYPTRGNHFQFSAAHYGNYLGSDYAFSSFLFDLCHYMPVFKNHVIAFRGVVGTMLGNPPFQAMFSLEDTLRGYSEGRFIDRNVITVQAEYRRLGLVGFVGAGQVADNLGDFRVDRFKPSTGAGLRFCVVQDERINLRIDYARGVGDSSLDIKIMEAF
jgi:outer membrane protein assembly factor BamA